MITGNTGVGSYSGYYNVTGKQNTYLGYEAGFGASGQSNSNNTGIGHKAMNLISTGGDNVVIGFNAGAAMTLAGQNVYIGKDCAEASNEGDYNTVVGHGSYKSASGNNANFNTVFGWETGKLQTTGANNTLIGAKAGDTLEEASGNTAVGYDVDFNSTNADGRIAIGQSFTATDDNSVHLGNDHGFVKNSFSSNNTWTQVSDIRLKKNINNDSLGLEFINELRPVTFNWKPLNEVDTEFIDGCPNHKGEKDTETLIHGLIAQEVKSAMDKVSNTTFNGWEEGIDGQSVSREMFITPLIKAVQELSSQVTELKKEIEELKN